MAAPDLLAPPIIISPILAPVLGPSPILAPSPVPAPSPQLILQPPPVPAPGPVPSDFFPLFAPASERSQGPVGMDITPDTPPPILQSPTSKSPGSQLSVGVIIGITIGVLMSLALASCLLLICRLRRRGQVNGGLQSRGLRGRGLSKSESKSLALPIRVNGVDSSVVLSHVDSKEQKVHGKGHKMFSLWWGGGRNPHLPSNTGVMRFSHKELQKATNNFTALLGQGAFGPVYKAVQPSGTILAVKMLSSHSKQGEREFDTEVMLLGRLHHRNLVNLVGYCADRGERMLVYEYMSNGSLAGFLYDLTVQPLSWEQRVHIAQDISRGIEYLHDGAIPAVVHRDIKSANILLDDFMTARVADFGLSKETESTQEPVISGVKGTFGYVDPEYVRTNAFTDKSDVYSFGVVLFELITGRNPQQGLMEYVHLAALGVEGKNGWGELLDPRLNGNCDLDSLGSMAAIAYKCVQPEAKARPRIRSVAQVLSKLGKGRHQHIEHQISLATVSEVSEDFASGENMHPIQEDSTSQVGERTVSHL